MTLRSDLPAALHWQPAASYEDVLFDRCEEGIARIRINRPHKRNAFRPRTVQELCDAFTRVREDTAIGVVLFTGAGPAADGGWGQAHEKRLRSPPASKRAVSALSSAASIERPSGSLTRSPGDEVAPR